MANGNLSFQPDLAIDEHNPLPRKAIDLDATPDERRADTELISEYVLNHIATIAQQPVVNLDGARELAKTFVERMPETGSSLPSLMPRLKEAISKTFNTAGPGYLAFIPGGGLYSAALAEFLSKSVNRYTGMWNAAPALVQMEVSAIDWIREAIKLPKGFTGILTSGGSISNLIAIITARRVRLPENFLDGIIYASKDAHHCVAKSALLAGFPESSLRWIETDSRRRMCVESLSREIAKDQLAGKIPFMVVSSAGTTNTGAIDPTNQIAEICQKENMWLHVDAAYGGFFRMVDDGENLIPGMEMADSIVLDPHKGLFLPYGTGCLLMKDPQLLSQAHRISADYLQDLETPDWAVNFGDCSPELSRDYRGLRVWIPFKMFGAEAFRDNLREKLELAQWAHRELAASDGFECFDSPQLSVLAFRYKPGSGDVNSFNERLLQRVREKGRVFLTSTRIDGVFMLRIAILSFRSHPENVVHAIEDLKASVGELESELANG